MLFLLVLTVGLLTVCVASVWPRSGGSPGAAGRPTRSKADAGPAATTAESRPVSLEGVLVRQLTAGDINRRQYRRTMADLAARDDERHPMSVPSDGGSDKTEQ